MPYPKKREALCRRRRQLRPTPRRTEYPPNGYSRTAEGLSALSCIPALARFRRPCLQNCEYYPVASLLDEIVSLIARPEGDPRREVHPGLHVEHVDVPRHAVYRACGGLDEYAVEVQHVGGHGVLEIRGVEIALQRGAKLSRGHTLAHA